MSIRYIQIPEQDLLSLLSLLEGHRIRQLPQEDVEIYQPAVFYISQASAAKKIYRLNIDPAKFVSTTFHFIH
jgi:hypothetical protein